MFIPYETPNIKPPQYVIAALHGAWRQHPRYRGCVAQWLFGEGGGTKVYDRGPNGLTGTFVGSPTPTIGPRGPVFDFDGVDDYVDLGSVPSLTMTTGLSISAWCRSAHATNNQRVIDKGAIGTSPYLEYSLNLSGNVAGKPSLEITTGGTLTALSGTQSYAVGTWFHLAGTWDGTTMRIYFNGIEDGSVGKTGTITPQNNNATLGYFAPFASFFFDGELDSITVFNRGLSSSEVFSIYSNPYLEYIEMVRRVTGFRRKLVHYSFAATQSTYSLNGQAVSTKQSSLLGSNQGSYSLGGQVASLFQSFPITAQGTSYTLNGQSVNFYLNQLITNQHGVFNFNGQAASLIVTEGLLIASGGVYTLTGQQAALLWKQFLSSLHAAYSLNGQNITFGVSTPLVAQHGLYTFSGQSLSFPLPFLEALTGFYTFTGRSINLSLIINDMLYTIELNILPSVSGVVQLQSAPINGASLVIIRKASIGLLHEVT